MSRKQGRVTAAIFAPVDEFLYHCSSPRCTRNAPMHRFSRSCRFCRICS